MELASAMMVCIAAAAGLIVYGSLMLSRLNVANYNQAREMALAEGELWEGLQSMDAITLHSTYSDEQICTMLGIPDASDEEINRARARLSRKHRKGQISGSLCGIIMLLATVAGLVMLFVPGYQTSYFWLAWAVGGILCGVACLAVNVFMGDE